MTDTLRRIDRVASVGLCVLGLCLGALGCETTSPTFHPGADVLDAAVPDPDARITEPMLDAAPDAITGMDAGLHDANTHDANTHDASARDANTQLDTGVLDSAWPLDQDAQIDASADDDGGGTVIDPLYQWTAGYCGSTCDCTSDPNAPAWLTRGSIRGDYHQANETGITSNNAHALRPLKLLTGGFSPQNVYGRNAHVAFSVPVRYSPNPPPTFLFVLQDAQRFCAADRVLNPFAFTENLIITPLYGAPLIGTGQLSPTPAAPAWVRTELIPPAAMPYAVIDLVPHDGRVVEWRHRSDGHLDESGATILSGSAELLWVEPQTGESTSIGSVDHLCTMPGGIAIDALTQTAFLSLWRCYSGVDGTIDLSVAPTGKMFAIDLVTGSLRQQWTLDDFGESYDAPPAPMVFAYTQGSETVTRVAIADNTHTLRVFDPGTGEEAWSVARPTSPSPRAHMHVSYDGERVILTRPLCTDPSDLACASFVTSIDWRSAIDGQVLRSMAVEGPVPPITSSPELTLINGTKLFVLDNATGALLWSYTHEGPPQNYITPQPAAIADGRIYARGPQQAIILGIE